MFTSSGRVVVNGTAIIPQSTVTLVIDEVFNDTKRFTLVEATQVSGRFSNVQLNDKKVRRIDGKCRTYRVGGQDSQATSVSVLLVSTETQCEANNSVDRWVVLGIILGVIGLFVIALGLLFLFRDIALVIARRAAEDEERFVI